MELSAVQIPDMDFNGLELNANDRPVFPTSITYHCHPQLPLRHDVEQWQCTPFAVFLRYRFRHLRLAEPQRSAPQFSERNKECLH